MKSAAKLGLLVLLAFAAAACERNTEPTPTSTHKWTWVSGGSTIDQSGVYGTKGAAAATNVPGSREGAVGWNGASGRLWLFGGYGFDASGLRDRLNDLWMFDPAAGSWTWVSGENAIDHAGAYGTKGLPAPANVPGARNGSAAWVDPAGDLWLFGGLGYSADGVLGHLNDLWKFDPVAGDWTWVSGTDAVDGAGTYGTLGSPSPSNVPGSRLGALSAIDGTGRLWLFGGFGFDSAGAQGWLNDLWVFDPATVQWTWISGGNTNDHGGTYGTEDTPAADNVPGGRYTGLAWLDASGNVWLFGGEGLDHDGTRGYLNDLWKYDPAVAQWTWISGSDVISKPGTYGAQDTPSATTVPGARFGAAAWTDADGGFGLFGGYGIDSSSTLRWLNDLWTFDPADKQWTWVAGSVTGGASGSYGTKGTADTANRPGARYSAVAWIDAQGKPWVFGGYGADSASRGGWLNDLWSFTK